MGGRGRYRAFLALAEGGDAVADAVLGDGDGDGDDAPTRSSLDNDGTPLQLCVGVGVGVGRRACRLLVRVNAQGGNGGHGGHGGHGAYVTLLYAHDIPEPPWEGPPGGGAAGSVVTIPVP